MGSVIICSGYKNEERQKLERFLGLFEEYAEALNVNFVLHACHGEPEMAVKDGNVHIHFFSCERKSEKVFVEIRYLMLREIFHYPVPCDGLRYDIAFNVHTVHGDNVGKRFEGKAGSGTIKSDSYHVAEVSPYNLWILFDIAHAPWHGDRLVLEKIIKMSLSRLIPGTPQSLIWGNKPETVFQSLRKKTESSLSGDNYQNLVKFFGKLSTNTLAANEENFLKEKGQLAASYEKKQTEIMSSFIKLETVEAELKKIPEITPSEDDLKKEFKEILSWDTINGIKIVGDKVCVFTKLLRISREDTRNNQTLTEYEIKFEIPGFWGINPKTIIKEIIIQEKPDGWKGDYISYFSSFSSGGNICFGSLEKNIVDAMLNNDIKSIIQLLISFITGDSRCPIEREKTKRSKGEYVCEPIYKNHDELTKSCLEYVEYMDKKLIEGKKVFVEKKIQELNETIGGLIKEATELYLKLRDKNEELNYVRKGFEDFIFIENEFKKFVDCPKLYNFLLQSDWIEASFVEDQSKGENIIIFVQPAFGLMNVTLPKEETVVPIDFFHVCPKFSYEFKKEILKLFSAGKVGSAVMVALDLAGRKIVKPSEKVSMRGEV